MKILLSPAKIMKPVEDFDFDLTKPEFAHKEHELMDYFQSRTYPELKDIFKVSDKVAKPIFDHYQAMKAGKETTLYPALLAYQGIAYQYMAPQIFTDDMWTYVNDHLRMISGMYGLLKPTDGITIYRLEMHTKCPFSLYEYWGSQLADSIPEDEVIVNLASEEYAKTFRKYRKMVDIRFCQDYDGKLKETAVYAKMARGAMVRFMAENNVQDPEGMKAFKELGFSFSPENSSESLLTFIQDPDWKKPKRQEDF